MNLEKKIELLKNEIIKHKKILIAYSGGVDSSLLLKVAVDTLDHKNIIAATGTSLTYTETELKTAKKIAKNLKIQHIIIKTSEFKNENFINNSELRCYYCKKELFNRLNEIKKEYNCDAIMDGSNFDDNKDFRPGTKAVIENNILTPLKTSKLTKKEIREYSKKLGLPTHSHPAIPCLATRIPYNEKITEKKIEKIKKGEEILSKYGFKNLRLRTTQTTARIEVDLHDFEKIMKKRDEIIKKLRAIGYDYISLDLEGFKSGSMNKVLNKKLD